MERLNRIDWDFAGYLPNGNGADLHTLHWYPATFIPAVAGTLIDLLSTGDRFLDPFCGAGSAVLEAWFRGKRSCGIDSNGFALRICEAKVALAVEGCQELATRLAESCQDFHRTEIRRIAALDSSALCSTFRFDPDACRWFDPQVLASIATVKSWAEQNEALQNSWRNTLLVILSSLLHKSLSVVRDYHYTYIVDRSKVQTENRVPVDVPAVFTEKLKRVFAAAEMKRQLLRQAGIDLEKMPRPVFCRGDSAKLQLPENEYDLVITSPPYFGMNDYVRSQYLSWLILGWLEYQEDLALELGSRRMRRSSLALDDYFVRMRASFRAIQKCLVPGSFLALLIGESKCALARREKILDRLDQILTEETGLREVWSAKRRVRFRKINNTPFTSEELRVFRKDGFKG